MNLSWRQITSSAEAENLIIISVRQFSVPTKKESRLSWRLIRNIIKWTFELLKFTTRRSIVAVETPTKDRNSRFALADEKNVMKWFFVHGNLFSYFFGKRKLHLVLERPIIFCSIRNVWKHERYLNGWIDISTFEKERWRRAEHKKLKNDHSLKCILSFASEVMVEPKRTGR